MRIRKFQADTIREALLQVKEEMGPEALILRSALPAGMAHQPATLEDIMLYHIKEEHWDERASDEGPAQPQADHTRMGPAAGAVYLYVLLELISYNNSGSDINRIYFKQFINDLS